MKGTVAYQGVKGAYSESAIYKHFGKDTESIGLETFEDVFEAVKNNKAQYGLLPFENTTAGSIAINYDLLLKEELVIIAEVFLKIQHKLLSHKGNKLKDIKRVSSHPHALDQCRTFLRKHKIKSIPEYDTAGAAKMLKEKSKEDAVIASDLCAEIYDLDIVASNLQNMQNITKFFVLTKKGNVPKDLKKEKTSIAFKTKHYPGALVNCLQRLAKNDVNLTKLESRPIPENPWEYVFYADFDFGIDEGNVKLALNEMDAASLFIKVLGSYPKGKK